MSKPFGLVSLLLATSALVVPSSVFAQTASAQPEPEAAPADIAQDAPADAQSEEAVDVSIPGANSADIVVVGTRRPDISRAAPQVVSVLSSADIARTGEGNIAGALGRVTGLSVVGNGFVYVRGLGDRYSLALLNGSPLPSPEPLKRVVPLDLFPSSVISSSLVQKSYSVNFPGEFGGGVINLTTKAIPRDGFLSFGASIGANTATTGQLGYTYYGGDSDFTGYSNGARRIAPALQAYFDSGDRISTGNVNTQAIASQLVRSSNAVIQRNGALPPNWSLTASGARSWDLSGDTQLGVIASAGYSNTWRTRDTIQQTASTRDLSQRELDFERVITDNRLVVNGLLGVSLEFGENKIRWTSVYIHDTLKQARLGIGTRATSGPTRTLQQQDTAWFERQLIDTQLVGEFKLTDTLSLDVRGTFANSKRRSPYELNFEYVRTNAASDPYGAYFVNQLNNGQRGDATISFSRLNEKLWSGGLDLSWEATSDITASVGYLLSDTTRTTERRDFTFTAPGTLPQGVGLLRPDLLLAPAVVNYFGINLIDTNENNPFFLADLTTHAGYGQIRADIIRDVLSIDIGVRYETAEQTVRPVQVFTIPNASLAGTNLNNDYFLPAATITWKLTPEMQLRFNGSKTIARPQFRELIFQNYFDPDSNRLFRGNPLLVDSQLYNAEVRYEWYYAREQRIAVAGFYKKIDNPIETFVSFSDNDVLSSFANAPSADLYGAEFEVQKYFDLSGFSGSFWASRRAVVIANYTYTNSNIKVGANDTVAVFAASSTRALDFFRDGVPLTGQSDHIANLQIGLEDTDHLSQQTFLLNYASDRVTNRGAGGQPDIVERPGFQLDFVARQGVTVFGRELEMKFEARNITGTRYQEFQQSGANRIYYNLYRTGTSFSFGATMKF